MDCDHTGTHLEEILGSTNYYTEIGYDKLGFFLM